MHFNKNSHEPNIGFRFFAAMASFPTLAPNSPHFFKIILADPLASEKLRIPKKFVRKYGQALSKSVSLEVPNGMVWKVDITRNGNEVWLENGWKQFAESYSLGPGHLLAFRYEGNSNFCVFIFDLSASEIDYKLGGVHDKDIIIPKMEESKVDDVFVENLDDCAPCTRPQKRMRNGSTFSENDDGANALHQFASHFNDETNLGKSKRKLEFSVEDFAGGDMSTSLLLPQSEDPVSTKSFTFGENDGALQRASAFETKNPSFEVFMQHSYIHPGFRLSIPANFVHKHFTRKNGDVNLSTSDGRTWSAKYAIKMYNQMEKAWLYSGWRAFMRDNCLKVGDVCVFEMIKCDGVSFKVIIFRETLGTNRPLSKSHWSIADHVKQKKRTVDIKMEKSENDASFDILSRNLPSQTQKIEGGGMYARRKRIQSKVYRSLKRLTFNKNSTNILKARAFKSENPSFMVVMHPSYIHKGFKLSVPSSFIERHFTEKNGELVLLTSDGRTWSTKYRFAVTNAKKNATLYGGWRDFVTGNCLKVGDVCVFELIKGNKVSLKVVIFRESNSANCPPSQDHGNTADGAKLKKKKEPDMEANVENAICIDILNSFSSRQSQKVEGSCGQLTCCGERASNEPGPSSSSVPKDETVGEKYPSFRAVMSSAILHHGSVSVPLGLARKFVKFGAYTVKLQVDDRFWPTKLVNYKNKSACFSKGWVGFTKQNALKIGDVCVFELIDVKDAIFKVSISRVSS